MFSATPFLALQRRLTVTCSIGVSSRANPNETDADALVREADLALYGAKGTGRDRVLVNPVISTAGELSYNS